MFGSEILDVALGLVLVFLLMSLIMTAVQEAIQTILKSRGIDLRRAITELLQGDQRLVAEFYDHPLVYAFHRGQRTAGTTAVDAMSAQGLDEKGKSLPSYIPRETFAAALIDLIADGTASGNPHVMRALDGMKRVVGPDVNALRREIEGWYDGAMDRASGWYKRRTQIISFWLGLTISVLLNINSVTIARHLTTDAQARHYVDRLSEQIASGAKQPDEKALYASLEQAGLPIGWNDKTVDKIERGFPLQSIGFVRHGAQESDVAYVSSWSAAVLLLIAGYFITAFAITLGAPFWFDVLNRIMVIRATVKPKEKSPDEPSEDGGKDRLRRNGSGDATPAGAGAGDLPAVSPTAPDIDRPAALTTPVYG